MTISMPAASAPTASTTSPLTGLVPEEERDAGVRAFRGLLIAAGLAVAFWGAIGLVAAGVIRLFS